MLKKHHWLAILLAVIPLASLAGPIEWAKEKFAPKTEVEATETQPTDPEIPVYDTDTTVTEEIQIVTPTPEVNLSTQVGKLESELTKARRELDRANARRDSYCKP